jgi:beta-lactamase superfamily II metal-dependent hydrolase
MTIDLKIFDVEHGACSLLTADNGTRLMIDCGHNGDTGWRPGTYLREHGISQLEMLAITNYDEDHASGSANLFDNVNVQWLWRNKSVSTAVLRSLKSEDGMGGGIDRLVQAIDYTFTGDGSSPQPVFGGVERQVFYNSYPLFDDENNLSMAVFLKCHGTGILFPGDLERPGWLELLKQEDFRVALSNTKVLVASHHGRENGCCKEVFDYCSPYYIVISDKGYMYDTQETIPFYRQFAKGGPFRDADATRRVLTTRKDGRIGFKFDPVSWVPY